MKFFLLPIMILSGILGVFYFQNQSKFNDRIKQTDQKIYELKETIAPQPTKISPTTNLPDKHLIETAFIQQAPHKDWQQPWQDACEEAALLTVDFYYKNQTPTADQQAQAILQMINHENDHGWDKDVNLEQMSHIASDHLGYQATLVKDPQITALKKYLASDIPIVVPANGKTLYKENKHFQNGGPYYHAIVLLGYDDTRSQFIVHDVGTQFGEYFRYSYDLVMDSIHDLPASMDKTQIDTGSKQVLVLVK